MGFSQKGTDNPQWFLALFGAAAVVSFVFGFVAGLGVVAVAALLESQPSRRQYGNGDEKRVVATVLCDFRDTWYVLWVALAFGA